MQAKVKMNLMLLKALISLPLCPLVMAMPMTVKAEDHLVFKYQNGKRMRDPCSTSDGWYWMQDMVVPTPPAKKSGSFISFKMSQKDQ